MSPSSLMVVPIYNGGGSYFREERLKIMGAVGSCYPRKKDNQALRGSGKLGQIGGYLSEGVRALYGLFVYGPIEEMGESRKTH